MLSRERATLLYGPYPKYMTADIYKWGLTYAEYQLYQELITPVGYRGYEWFDRMANFLIGRKVTFYYWLDHSELDHLYFVPLVDIHSHADGTMRGETYDKQGKLMPHSTNWNLLRGFIPPVSWFLYEEAVENYIPQTHDQVTREYNRARERVGE